VLFTRAPLVGLKACFWILLSLGVIFLDSQHHLKKIRPTLSYIITPIQYLVAWPAQIMHMAEANLASHDALLNENASLRAKQLWIQIKQQKLAALEQENQQLRTLLYASSQANSERFLAAQILAITTDPLIQQVIVDKGSKAGIYVGQAVLDADGIMGQVIEVGPITSRVLLITDPSSAVPVQNIRNGIRGIVVGGGNPDELRLVHMPETADIRQGDVLISSGLGQRYPKDYRVGVVRKVMRMAGEHFAMVSVRPSAHINRSQYVLLIWLKKGQAMDANFPNKNTKLDKGKLP
jgi:rod shape-determining protein MreC